MQQKSEDKTTILDYRSMLKDFIWRVMVDDHVVAIKAIDSCPNKSERRVLIELTEEVATTGNDEDVLMWMRRIFERHP